MAQTTSYSLIDLSTTPGTLLTMASLGTRPKRCNWGDWQFSVTTDDNSERSYWPPVRVSQQKWKKLAASWCDSFVDAFEQFQLCSARFELVSSSEDNPKSGTGVDAHEMPAAWKAFSRAVNGICLAGCRDLALTNIDLAMSLDFWGNEQNPRPKGGNFNINWRDKPILEPTNRATDIPGNLLRHVLGPATLAEGNKLFDVCPAWFAPFKKIDLHLKINLITPEMTANAIESHQQVAADSATAIQRFRARPAKQTIYKGWEDFDDDHLGDHSWYHYDSWVPAWIVWYGAHYRDEVSDEMAERIDVWCIENCTGCYRHSTAGVWEFAEHADAVSFEHRWCGEPGDTLGY
jgi:hypothetical protein